MLNNIPGIAIIIIVFVFIASPWILNKIKNKQGLHNSNPATAADMEILDQPVSFGYKCMWFAIKSVHMEELIKILNLTDIRPCNWNIGIEKAYENSVFITPPVNGWTIACGLGLPHGDSKKEIEYLKSILQKLSRDYGEAQFFCTNRIVEYHCWMKAVEGNIKRVYTYLGEANENILIEGEATDFEKTLHLVDTFSEDAKEKNYFEREDIALPDEEIVMKIAENWSINPSTLESRNDLMPALGLLGERNLKKTL
jgi:hypothetical protein